MMNNNIHAILRKMLIAMGCALTIVCALLGLYFLRVFVDLRDFERSLHRLHLASASAAICFYGILPSLIAITVTELMKGKKLRTYIMSSVLCLMVLLVGLYAWIEIIVPFLESKKTVAVNNFGHISANPHHTSISVIHSLLGVGFYGSFVNIIFTWLYWLLAIRGKKISVKNWKKIIFRVVLLSLLVGALLFYIFPTFFIAGK